MPDFRITSNYSATDQVQKIMALKAYQSQLDERPYDEVTIALSRFRSMTLPQEVTHAEGFSVWSANMMQKAGYWGISLMVGMASMDSSVGF